MVNMDDITGESIPHIIDGLMEQGANSAHAVNATTKKGRPEYILFVDTDPENAEKLAGYIAQELGTIGVRLIETSHIHFEFQMIWVRATLSADGAPRQADVRVKRRYGSNGEILGVKADHDDLTALRSMLAERLKGWSLQTLKHVVEQTALTEIPCSFGDLKMEVVEERVE